MDERRNDCIDCVQAKTLGERLDRISEKVCKCEEEFDKRIHTLEKQVAVNDEKFKQVFEKLDKIIAILDKNSDRLPNVVWGIIGAVIGGLVLWGFKGF
jgi:flagellar capping protein FliD